MPAALILLRIRNPPKQYCRPNSRQSSATSCDVPRPRRYDCAELCIATGTIILIGCSLDVTLGGCFPLYIVGEFFQMAVRGTDPCLQSVSETYSGRKFVSVCLKTARGWSRFPKLPHWIPRRIELLFVGIAFVIAARAATMPKQFHVLEDDASGVVHQVSSVAAPVANPQRQRHATVRASKSETSVAQRSIRHGHPSEQKLAKAGEGKQSPKQSSTARRGVSQDQIRK